MAFLNCSEKTPSFSLLGEFFGKNLLQIIQTLNDKEIILILIPAFIIQSFLFLLDAVDIKNHNCFFSKTSYHLQCVNSLFFSLLTSIHVCNEMHFYIG